jgi:hypothetical protein
MPGRWRREQQELDEAENEVRQQWQEDFGSHNP